MQTVAQLPAVARFQNVQVSKQFAPSRIDRLLGDLFDTQMHLTTGFDAWKVVSMRAFPGAALSVQNLSRIA